MVTVNSNAILLVADLTQTVTNLLLNLKSSTCLRSRIVVLLTAKAAVQTPRFKDYPSQDDEQEEKLL
jgi:hypothetical protein